MTDEEALKEIDRQEKRLAAAKCGRGLRLAKSAREHYQTIVKCRQKSAEVAAECAAANEKAVAMTAETNRMEAEARQMLKEVSRRRSEVAVAVNGRAVNGVPGPDGHVSIAREWKEGDAVELDLPMPVKRIRAHEKVEADRGRLAVERGPIVYCAEGIDNGGKAYEAVLPADATFTDDTITIGGKTYPALKASTGLKLIPYCLWGNRQPGNELQCWFKEWK